MAQPSVRQYSSVSNLSIVRTMHSASPRPPAAPEAARSKQGMWTHAQNLRRLGSCLLFADQCGISHDQKDVDPRIIQLLSFQSICSANSHCTLVRSNVQTKRIVRSQTVVDTRRPALADACQDRAWCDLPGKDPQSECRPEVRSPRGRRESRSPADNRRRLAPSTH